jgi:hypothetical protein
LTCGGWVNTNSSSPKGDAQQPEMPIHLLDTSLLCNLSVVRKQKMGGSVEEYRPFCFANSDVFANSVVLVYKFSFLVCKFSCFAW